MPVHRRRLHVGNWSAASEFNIVIGPEAAHIVFNESWKLTMVGLDLTHQALATPDVVAKIAADFRSPASADCTTHEASDLDHGRFWALIVRALERIGDAEL